MECEHGRSLGIYCKECGPSKTNGNKSASVTGYKACPFCGERGVLHNFAADHFYVGCDNKNCSVQPITKTDISKDGKQAIAYWEERAL